MQTVGDGTYSATYSYLANSPLVSQIVFKHSATTRMTTPRQYDKLNRRLHDYRQIREAQKCAKVRN